MTDRLDLRTDPNREGLPDGRVRAFDIAELDRDSLRRWLRQGGSNPIAENTVLILLGHETT
jgi:hypothetical protein